jgi:hypothetical protein
MTPAEQTEQIAQDVFHAQRGDWPADLAQALRMVRLAVALSEAQQMLVALRVMELCKEAEGRNA